MGRLPFGPADELISQGGPVVFEKGKGWRVFFLLAGVACVTAAATASQPVSAKAKKKKPGITHIRSYAVFDGNGASMGSTASACGPKGCANGITFHWDAGACVSGEHFAPIVLVFTQHRTVAPRTWPMVAPCSTGITMTWDTHNHLNLARWTGASNARYGLAVCFQHAGQCGHSICVTDGCLPANTDGVDIFFEGTASLTEADWTRNGKAAGSVQPSGPANDVYWYGGTPPSSPFAHPARAAHRHVNAQAIAPPTVTLLGRDPQKYPQLATAPAPTGTNHINFKWFLNPPGPHKHCIVAGGATWTNPPMEFAYMTDGSLNSRVSVLTCPMSATGQPVFYNGVEFAWGPSRDGTENNVYSAVPTFDAQPLPGLLVGLIPQPPAGTDGILFEFHHDDYEQTTWPPVPSVLPAPGHTRMAVWQG